MRKRKVQRTDEPVHRYGGEDHVADGGCLLRVQQRERSVRQTRVNRVHADLNSKHRVTRSQAVAIIFHLILQTLSYAPIVSVEHEEEHEHTLLAASSTAMQRVRWSTAAFVTE